MSDLPAASLAATVRGLGPRAEETVMTTAEKLHQQGVREGHERGVREGLERSLRMLLERRFGELPTAFAARLREADVDHLLRGTERVLTAASLDEVLEG